MKTISKTLLALAMGTAVYIAAILLVDISCTERHSAGGASWIEFSIKDAEARVGNPLSPGSVAGVARRTTRRTIRRTSRYVNTLPRGCTTVVIEGTSLHQCGGTYYQFSGNQYVIVNVD